MLRYTHAGGGLCRRVQNRVLEFAYADWDNRKQPDPAVAKSKILDNIHNGEVMLLHPTSATNAAILGEVLQELKARGYRFGTLNELVGGEGA